MIELFEIDYNPYIDLVGTAHFTRRSLNDAYTAIKAVKPKDVAIELDWRRFRLLNTACIPCPKRGSCLGICEFIGATDALGNVSANIWLIDMTEQEMRQRIRRRRSPFERSPLRFSTPYPSNEDPIRLWEMGFKDRVIHNEQKQIAILRKIYPSMWEVLIDERNALMAARLAWIASQHLVQEKPSKILTFVGAAHVEGIRTLLSNPQLIKESLRTFNLSFTEPPRIRRVAVTA